MHKRTRSILALAFEGRRLELAVLRKNGGDPRVERWVSEEWTLPLLGGDPALLGREIRERLDRLEIRERQCVVGIPFDWVLTHGVTLPELDPSLEAGFLDLQTEKAFPFPPEDLQRSVSKVPWEEGRRALVTAVPRKHLARLERILEAAGLKPVSLSLGITALSAARTDLRSADFVLRIHETGAILMLHTAAGPVFLRPLNDALEMKDGETVIRESALIRELRVTLAQLPASLRQSIQQLRIEGPENLARAARESIAAGLEKLGLQGVFRPCEAISAGPVVIPRQDPMPLAVALGGVYLHPPLERLEFLPPKVHPWVETFQKLQSRKFGVLGALAGGLAGILILAFLWQGWTLGRLEKRWISMEDDVQRLTLLNGKTGRFRSWYDNSQPNLRMLQALVQAFPMDGKVTAKTLEIRNRNTISCTGVATDNQAILETLQKLRDIPQIQALEVEGLRGKAPLQFSFNFNWKEGAGRGR